MALVMMVRPWKLPENAMMPPRPVATRAIFTAFSTASAPVVKKIVRAGPANGASAFSRSASAT